MRTPSGRNDRRDSDVAQAFVGLDTDSTTNAIVDSLAVGAGRMLRLMGERGDQKLAPGDKVPGSDHDSIEGR